MPSTTSSKKGHAASKKLTKRIGEEALSSKASEEKKKTEEEQKSKENQSKKKKEKGLRKKDEVLTPEIVDSDSSDSDGEQEQGVISGKDFLDSEAKEASMLSEYEEEEGEEEEEELGSAHTSDDEENYLHLNRDIENEANDGPSFEEAQHSRKFQRRYERAQKKKQASEKKVTIPESSDDEMEVDEGKKEVVTSWVDEDKINSPSDYEGENAKPRPVFDFSQMVKKDLTPVMEALKKKKREERKNGKVFVHPLSPLVCEYLNVLSFLTSKKNESIRKGKLLKNPEEKEEQKKRVKAILYMQLALIKKIRPIFPDLDVVYPLAEWEEKYIKKRKAEEENDVPKKRKKSSTNPVLDSSSDEDDTQSLQDEERGKVRGEEVFERKRVVETLKGDHKKKVFFQLNQRWSIYSDEATAHRGLEEKFDVITICRQPIPAANPRVQQKSVKAYKMSFPISQGTLLISSFP